MKLLTVAVPAYNIEKYLAQCLDSVINEELEVLVVNDGSTDNTEAVAKEYERRYPGVFRVITKQNGGWGSGINRAIDEASGEYFVNLDSDDWFDAEGLKVLLHNLRNHKVDLVLAPGFEHSMKSGREWPIQFPKNCVYGCEIQADELLPSLDFFFTVHSLVIRTEILKRNKIRIDECFYTDMELLAFPIPYVDTVFIQKEPLYIYRVDRDGQSVSLASRAKHPDDMERVTGAVSAWYNAQSGPRMPYYTKIMTTVIYAWITYPFVFQTDKQREYIPKLKQFKADVIDRNPNLADYSQYGLFARAVLKRDFNNYSSVARLWRFSMRNRGLTTKLWNAFR